MLLNIKVGLDIGQKNLYDIVKNNLEQIEMISIVDTTKVDDSSLVFVPNIFITLATSNVEDVCEKIATLKRKFSKSVVFVVSAEQRPDLIIEVMKSGASEFFIHPINFEKLLYAIEKIRMQLANETGGSKGSLFSFLSSKGGLGATVLAANSAAAIALQGNFTTALVDLSLQSGDSSVLLDMMPQTTIADIYKNFDRLDVSFFKGTMQRHLTGLDFLAAPANPEESVLISGEHIHKVLSLSKNCYDVTIVDCPSMFVNDCSLEAFKASDKIFVVTDLSVPAIRNASRLLKLMTKLGINPRQIEIVVNRFINGKFSIHDIEKNLNKSVFWLFPNDYDFTVASINRGIPLVKQNKGASLAKNISDFAKKIVNPEVFENYRGAKGLFGSAI